MKINEWDKLTDEEKLVWIGAIKEPYPVYTQKEMDVKLLNQRQLCTDIMTLYLLKIHNGVTVADAEAVDTCLNATGENNG